MPDYGAEHQRAGRRDPDIRPASAAADLRGGGHSETRRQGAKQVVVPVELDCVIKCSCDGYTDFSSIVDVLVTTSP